MRNLLSDFVLYFKAWYRLLVKRSWLAFIRFESGKDVIVEKLTFGRGKLVRPFVHSGMAVLFILGIAIAPIISQSSIVNKVQDLPSPSAVLSAATTDESNTSTFISEKPRSEVLEYQVKQGDTVAKIAEMYGISTDTIRWANDLTSVNAIKPGQILKILPLTGIAHKVKKGDTIYSIAKYYSTDAQGIVDYPFNTFTNDETFALAVGQTIFVPDGAMPKAVPWSPSTYIARQTPDAGAVSAIGSFVWPTSGIISQRFSWYHGAIDIANRISPAILAADAGKIIASGWVNGGYGNRVIIDHGNGYRTLYAHMQKIYVTAGQSVNRGDQLGQMGSTGRSTGTHLHFEIIRGSGKVDPLAFLK